jgi:hypothetical protein
MPRRVELVSGAYLDYYYYCTVIVVSWYAPNGDLRRGTFLGLAHFGILECGVLVFSTLARVWSLRFQRGAMSFLTFDVSLERSQLLLTWVGSFFGACHPPIVARGPGATSLR